MDRAEFLATVFRRGIEPRCTGVVDGGASYKGCRIHPGLRLYVNAHLDGLARVHLRTTSDDWKAVFARLKYVVPSDELDHRDNGPGETGTLGAEWTVHRPPDHWTTEVEKALLYAKILLQAADRASGSLGTART